jgi:hypothetical protein
MTRIIWKKIREEVRKPSRPVPFFSLSFFLFFLPPTPYDH